MNKLSKICSLIFTLVSLSSFADSPAEGPNFTYSVQSHAHKERDVNSLVSRLDHFFATRELYQVFLPKGLFDKPTSLETMDRIYSGANGETTVMIKAGVTPSDSSLLENIVQIDNGYLAHIRQPNGLILAVLVKSGHWENASWIFSSLKSSFTSSVEQKNSRFELISSAYAEVDPECDPAIMSTSEISHLSKSGEEIADEIATPMQHLTGCAFSAVKGVWNGSGGVVTDTLKAAGEFITSPIETGKKYWESGSKLWDASKKFFADFENEARGLYTAFDALDPLTKTKLACEVLGTIGGGVILTYLTAGVAASGALINIKNALQSVLKTAKFSNVQKALKKRQDKIKETEMMLKTNLFDIDRGTPEMSLKENNQVLLALDNLPAKINTKRKAGLDDDEVRQLYQQVSNHPVASLAMANNYSKNSPGMGYCFGRATTAHIKALANGLDKDSVRKVWALGNLKTGDTEWRYHVTTVVRDNKGKWHAIDPIMGRAMPVESWYKEMKKFDSEGNMRIFDTEPKRFGPSSALKYNKAKFTSPDFEGYFTDLMGTFREEASALAAQKRLAR